MGGSQTHWNGFSKLCLRLRVGGIPRRLIDDNNNGGEDDDCGGDDDHDDDDHDENGDK